MEPRTVLALFLVVFVASMVYSFAKGLDATSSFTVAIFLSGVSVLLIYFGKKIVQPY